MIIYNVTISIDASESENWLSWMRTKHIPDVLNTGCFLEAKLSKIIGEEEGGLAYSVMYLCASQEILDTYNAQHAPALQKEHLEYFSGKFAAFRTHLQLIEVFNPS
jgi:hypothetical protein